MEHMPYSQIQKGTFLVATPDIDMGVFFRGVILICEHNTSGSFGLVINKSIDLELPEEIININNLANPHISIRAGGPVQTNQMMLLHTSDQITQQTLQICDGVHLWGRPAVSTRSHCGTKMAPLSIYVSVMPAGGPANWSANS